MKPQPSQPSPHHPHQTGLRMAHALCALDAPTAAWLDWAGEAALGYVESAARYDPGRGATLSTYAFARMRGRTLDAIRAEARYLRACEGAMYVADPGGGASLSERLDAQRAVDRVTPELASCERVVLDAVYAEDRSLREVAARGRWSEDQLHRAHKRLLARLRAAMAVTAEPVPAVSAQGL